MKTFEEVRKDLDVVYSNALQYGELRTAQDNGLYHMTEDDLDEEFGACIALYNQCHQVISNALTIFNKDNVEDEFQYDIPTDKLADERWRVREGKIVSISKLPIEGVVWFTMEDGSIYDDDDINVFELMCVATAIYDLTD